MLGRAGYTVFGGAHRGHGVSRARPVVLAVVLHNAMGLTAGYGLGLLATGDLRIARTLAIEVGIQNSGLAVALAVQYFSAAAAIPGALFSIWHNLSGSALAALWSRRRLPAVAAADRR